MGSTILTGWSLPASYHTADKFDSVIDSTELVASFFENGELSSKWEELLCKNIESNSTAPLNLTGFSLGAMLALRYAQLRPVKRLTLLAPCFSFISRENHPSGVKESMLNQMIANIPQHRELTMKKFYRNCGCSSAIESIYSTYELVCGLRFLSSVEIQEIKLAGNPSIEIIHGSADRIIPVSSGKRVAEQYNTVLQSVPGGHIAPLSI